MDSLKPGWRTTEFWFAVIVSAAGLWYVAHGQPWPGLVTASVASFAYSLSRGINKAANNTAARRGAGSSRVV